MMEFRLPVSNPSASDTNIYEADVRIWCPIHMIVMSDLSNLTYSFHFWRYVCSDEVPTFVMFQSLQSLQKVARSHLWQNKVSAFSASQDDEADSDNCLLRHH